MINSRTYRKFYMEATFISSGDTGHTDNKVAVPRKIRSFTGFNRSGWVKAAGLPVLIVVPFLLRWTGSMGWSAVAMLFYLSCIVALTGFGYLNYFFLIPEFYLRRRFAIYFGSVLVLGCMLGAIAVSIQRMMAPGHIALLAYLTAILTGVVVVPLLSRLQQAKYAAEKQLANAQLRTIQEKVRNGIAGRVLGMIASLHAERGSGSEIVHRLPEILSFVKVRPDGLSSIEEEIECIRNYVWLHKRTGQQSLSVQCRLPQTPGSGRIAALSFLSVIDHVFLQEGLTNERPLNIEVRQTDDLYQLQVIYAKGQRNFAPLTQTYWLADLRQQLGLQYPSMHELEILENENICSVKLTLQAL